MSNTVTCEKCGKKIFLDKSNWKVMDHGGYVHNKCPASKDSILTSEEQLSYHKLMDRIKYHQINNPKGYILETGVNYKYAAQRIKALKDDGYSYDDQLYALDKIVEIQNGFLGFGSVVNNIVRLIAERNKQQEQIDKVKTDKITDEVKFKFDLADDDFSW